MQVTADVFFASVGNVSNTVVSRAVRKMSLAILGDEPVFSHPLHVGCPNIGNRSRLIARINAALDRRWLTNGGPLVEEFEAAVAEVAGVSECVVTSN